MAQVVLYTMNAGKKRGTVTVAFYTVNTAQISGTQVALYTMHSATKKN
jgi:hypothetical protein